VFEILEEHWPERELARARELAAGRAPWLLDSCV
jgi:hypothetical protein